jgi:L-rhamnose mutarotase
MNGVMKIGTAVGIRPEHIDRYCELHANPWPEVLAENRNAGRSNYSIFLLRQRNLLFSYYERTGPDQRGTAGSTAGGSPVMQEWWNLCRSFQVPLVPAEGPRLWADMERIFHQP